MGFFSFLTPKLPVDTQQIEQAISHLEHSTSAELRVVIERKIKKVTALDRANQLFEQLKMRETAQRNGVLIYLCLQSRLIAVVGDDGIHQQVGEDFWQSVYATMRQHCQQGNFTQAIVEAIQQVEEPLTAHFPIQPDDVNELPNEVIIK